MTINDYQQACLRTLNVEKSDDILVNGAMGLCGESGEVVDLIKKWKFQGHSLDRNKLIEELGDVAWYLAVESYGAGVPLELVMQHNLAKLRNRYPDGFDAARSVHRPEYTEDDTSGLLED